MNTDVKYALGQLRGVTGAGPEVADRVQRAIDALERAMQPRQVVELAPGESLDLALPCGGVLNVEHTPGEFSVVDAQGRTVWKWVQ